MKSENNNTPIKSSTFEPDKEDLERTSCTKFMLTLAKQFNIELVIILKKDSSVLKLFLFDISHRRNNFDALIF